VKDEKISLVNENGVFEEANASQLLQDALTTAASQGKLVFCSSPDLGNITKEEARTHFPVGCEGNIFRIGAATADRLPWSTAGGPNVVDHTFPGHDVPEKNGDGPVVRQRQQDTLHTGSSVATALAAGLAAQIIHIVRLAAMYSCRHHTPNPASGPHGSDGKRPLRNLENLDLVQSFFSIKEYKNMKKLFVRMQESGNTYVHVYDTFNTYVNQLAVSSDMNPYDNISEMMMTASGSKEERKWTSICELANRLMPARSTSGTNTNTLAAEGRVLTTALPV